VAKLVAALARGRQTAPEVFGINLLLSRELPLVCLPTTAGTGAEVSPNAILLDETDELKKGVVSPHLVPDAAFVDPLLTISVPPAVTAATGLDALTHCIEAYANKFAHPIVDTYALQGIKLISANLVRAVRNGNDIEARAALALGSLYGGLCLGPVNTAAVHALAYPLGGRFHIAHGVSNALLLPHVLRFNLSAAPERYAEIAAALGVTRNGSAMTTAERGVEFLSQLSRDCGVPQKLSDLKIPRAAIPSLAKAALQVQRLLKNNLRPVTEADAVKIYEATF
jgi:alcohol dehydrogenase class IV